MTFKLIIQRCESRNGVLSFTDLVCDIFNNLFKRYVLFDDLKKVHFASVLDSLFTTCEYVFALSGFCIYIGSILVLLANCLCQVFNSLHVLHSRLTFCFTEVYSIYVRHLFIVYSIFIFSSLYKLDDFLL